MENTNLEQLENRMVEYWSTLLATPLARNIKSILANGDRQLYALWLCQVAHLTRHTSAHQALVGVRIDEISHPYMKFCFEHAAEEVGHEMMAVSDLRKIGVAAQKIDDLPQALSATLNLTDYLYNAARVEHPATRLGFSYWAEKCYPFIRQLASSAKDALGLKNHQMTFFVSHAQIDEKHARDVEAIVQVVCKTPEDWQAVERGMIETLNLAVEIFKEIHSVVEQPERYPQYTAFLDSLKDENHAATAQLL